MAKARKPKRSRKRMAPVVVAGLVHPDWATREPGILDEPQQLRLARDEVFLAIRDEKPEVLDGLAEIAPRYDGDIAALEAEIGEWSERWGLAEPWMRQRARAIVDHWSCRPDAREKRQITYVASGPANLAPLMLQVPRYDEYVEATKAAEGRGDDMPWAEAVERGYAAYEQRVLREVRAVLREQRKRLPKDTVPTALARNIRWVVQSRLCGKSLRDLAVVLGAKDEYAIASEKANLSKSITRTAKFLGWPAKDENEDGGG